MRDDGNHKIDQNKLKIVFSSTRLIKIGSHFWYIFFSQNKRRRNDKEEFYSCEKSNKTSLKEFYLSETEALIYYDKFANIREKNASSEICFR